MAAALKLSASEFRLRFNVRLHDDGTYSVEATEGRPCPLLMEDGTCSVHSAKPTQCATFPFWEELVLDEEAWNAAQAKCEGINHPEGREYPPVLIGALLKNKGKT